MTVPLLVLDERLRRHLARALAGYRRDCRRDGFVFPPELGCLVDVLDSGGQERSNGDGVDGDGEDRRMPLLLEPEDAARWLSVSERTLRRLTKDGEVRAVKIGNLTRFAPEDLRQFVDEKRGS